MKKYLVQATSDPTEYIFCNGDETLRDICEELNGENFDEDFFEGSEDEDDENFDFNYHSIQVFNLEKESSFQVFFNEETIDCTIKEIEGN